MRDYTGILRLPQMRHYLLLVLFCGTIIMLMGVSLPWVPKTHSNGEYLAAVKDRGFQKLSEAKSVMDMLAANNDVTGGRGRGDGERTPSAETSTKSESDPLWMRARNSGALKDSIGSRWAPAALAFVPEKKQVHPYLPRYVFENSRLCQDKGSVVSSNTSDDPLVDVVLLIHSEARNVRRRRFLRETWAGPRVMLGVKVTTVFVLGRDVGPVAAGAAQSSGNEKDKKKEKKKPQPAVPTQLLINTEQANHGDIVQGDFLDTPGNRTLKALTGLRWVNDNCLPRAGSNVPNSTATTNNSGVRFVLKADDDVFVNIFALVEHFLQQLFSSATKQDAGGDRGGGDNGVLMCEVKTMNASRVILSKAASAGNPAKTEQAWAKFFKPDSGNRTFCAGHLVVMTADVVPALYRASFFGPPLPEDDVLVYGLLPALAAEAGNREGKGKGGNAFLRYLNVSEHFAPDFGKLLKHYTDSSDRSVQGVGASARPPSIGVRVSSDTGFVQIWSAVLQTLSPWASERAVITKIRGTVPPGLM